MDEQNRLEPHPDPSEETVQPAEDRILWGCLSAFLVVTILGYVAGAGFFGLGSLTPGLPGLDSAGAHAVRAGGYALLLIVPFGLVAIFLRAERFALWRGLALSLAAAGGHALVVSGLQVANHAERYPTLPYWCLCEIWSSTKRMRPGSDGMRSLSSYEHEEVILGLWVGCHVHPLIPRVEVVYFYPGGRKSRSEATSGFSSDTDLRMCVTFMMKDVC